MGSYKVTILNIYILFSSVFVLISIIILSLVFFTPLKKWIPGYGDIKDHTEFIQLRKEMSSLEAELETQQIYTKSLRQILTADGESIELANTSAPSSQMTSSPEELDHAEIKESKNTGILSQLFITAPVAGTISAGYDKEIDHYGIDILAPKNTPIKSILEGKVISSDWTLETGNTIFIQHPHNIISVYKHNSVLLKKSGDHVRAGEAIAIIGNTGTLSDGPHLHFEMWYNGNPVNPINFITFK